MDRVLRDFCELCRRKILEGADYKQRIMSSPDFMRLRKEYDEGDVLALIEKVHDAVTDKERLDHAIRRGWEELLKGRRALLQDTAAIPDIDAIDKELIRVCNYIAFYHRDLLERCTYEAALKRAAELLYDDIERALRAREATWVKLNIEYSISCAVEHLDAVGEKPTVERVIGILPDKEKKRYIELGVVPELEKLIGEHICQQ